MKKLLWGVGAFCLICAGLVGVKVLAENAPTTSVLLYEIKLKTVNETASASGYIRYGREEKLSAGVPGEIVEVAVAPGDTVRAGDVVFCYRPLEKEELYSLISGLSGELEALDTQPEDILAAAEFYGANGKLPSWFSGFYLPGDNRSGQNGLFAVRAGMDGVVESVTVSPGDTVTGLVPGVYVVGGDELLAEVDIPQEYLGTVSPGQHVNLSCSAFPGEVFSATVSAVGDRARTVGGLISSARTVVDGELTVNGADGRLIPGLAVRADIFVNVWHGAAVIPYSAVCNGEGGVKYVWVWKDGVISRQDIDPVYSYSRGYVTVAAFYDGQLIVAEPTDGMYEGMELSGEIED